MCWSLKYEMRQKSCADVLNACDCFEGSHKHEVSDVHSSYPGQTVVPIARARQVVKSRAREGGGRHILADSCYFVRLQALFPDGGHL